MRRCFIAAMMAVSALGVYADAFVERKGPVSVACEKPSGWKFDVSTCADGGRDVVTVTLTSETESKPPEFDVSFIYSGADIAHVWTGDFTADAPRLWPKAWGTVRFSSQLAFEQPLMVAFNCNNRSRLATACSEVFEKVCFGLTVNETTCKVEGRYRFFTENVSLRRKYSVKIMIDRRDTFWGEALSSSAKWIEKESGCVPASVPECAREALYSTWYAYWQDVHADELEREAELAAKLGMKTMILDDGWQKEKSASYYSATGDWMPVKSRFPDMRAHVAAVKKTGLKYMLWLSVPYVGDESQAWKRFSDKFVKIYGDRTPGRIGILDPRFPEVREYLISTYVRAVRDWGFDGLKLDFIDQITLPAVDPAVKQNYAGRDIKSLPAVVDKLMRDVLSALKAVKSDVMVEFRQHYSGPAIRQYGNMIRAADCPVDPMANRRRIADLRLTSGETAVHSDMIVWSPDETPQGAARPILNALFGVIQYSMVLQRIPESHRRVMSHWIGFAERHRKTLQQGEFRPYHPELNYTLMEAESAAERIIAVYAEDTLVRAGAPDKPVYAVNATYSESLPFRLAAAAEVEFFDVFGGSKGVKSFGPGLVDVAVPPSGYVKITWKR